VWIYNRVVHAIPIHTWSEAWSRVLDNWSEKAFAFLRDDVPHLVGIIIVALVLLRILKGISNRIEKMSRAGELPSGLRAQQLRTMSGVIHGAGMFFIVFLTGIFLLKTVGIDVAPLLASAGVVGLAIGFGAQTLVKDMINGFFILLEDQYEIGDTVKIGGVQGAVELMTLRRTVLRDADGTVHVIPNSTLSVVSNLTRDWTQVSLHISIDYKEDSDRVIGVLREAVGEVRSDEHFAELMVADPVVHGIDRVRGTEVEYLVTAKTRPGQQYGVIRELRRVIKNCLQKNEIQPGAQTRFFVDGVPAK
jgi:moderate conductance mechanosensitive channel